MERSNNDLNVLGMLPIFNDIIDGISSEYATFVKSYAYLQDEKRKLFKLAQEEMTLHQRKINNVLIVCVILHNMVLEDKGRAICIYNPNDVLHPPIQIQVDIPKYYTRIFEIQN
uniref:Uncharacterized protein n=1 Tax=Lactuca sativa TaxID=4236 RepID=A0A9R1WG81_LACSA|nr:hypothetical protein LSAT_V11C200087310 [Lactuca sativa]